MNRSRIVLSIILGIVGLVWIAQGLGYVRGSFMTSDMKWTIIGTVILVVALVLAVSARRKQP